MTKLRMMLALMVTVQVALVLAAAGQAGPDGAKGKPSTDTSSGVLVEPGFHRGG